MLDVRVRRALVHAVDRQAVVDALLEGQSPVSHTFIPPDDARWDWVKDVVARYDYDVRRTHDLLAEVGWRRGADGSFSYASGERVVLGYETSSALERTTFTVAPYLKATGVDIDQVVLSPGDARDARRVVQFPALQTSNIPLSFEQNLERLYGARCPSEGNRWTGFNSGCFQNAEHDRLIDSLRTEIEASAQQRLWRDMVKLQSEEVPVIPLFFLIVVTIFREGVVGVRGDTNPRSGATWNVAEWDVL
jgi:peptide/nickel transport system substrate-binding protein